MPGHKGEALLGFEPLDITEIDGADKLFTAHGIIAESEAQAGALFGAHTVYAIRRLSTPPRCWIWRCGGFTLIQRAIPMSAALLHRRKCAVCWQAP